MADLTTNDSASPSAFLNPLPSGWQTMRLKHLVALRSGDSITSESIDSEGKFPVYGGNGLRGFASSFNHDGDYVLIGRQGALCGNINYAHGKFWASEHAVVVSPVRDFDYVWLGEMLRSMNLNQYSVSAAQPGLAVERIRNLYLTVPPLEDQQLISRFLSTLTSRINRLIRNKRRLIALLTEQKQAIIQQAVTRGLDPDVPLKPSEVAWLGDIPAHWDVLRGKHFMVETDVRSADGSEEQLSVSHLTGVTPRSQKNITMFKAQSYVGHKIAHVGEIVVNTMWAWMAALGVSQYDGLVSPSYATYRQLPPARFDEKYLDLLLRTPLYRDFYASRSTGIRSSRLRLYPDEFLDIRYLAPPLAEQNEMLSAIKEHTHQIDGTISRALQEIDLIREYRTRLIADVVTGQIDVRDLATSLPEERPEPALEFLEPADWDSDLGGADGSDLLEEEMVEA